VQADVASDVAAAAGALAQPSAVLVSSAASVAGGAGTLDVTVLFPPASQVRRRGAGANMAGWPACVKPARGLHLWAARLLLIQHVRSAVHLGNQARAILLFYGSRRCQPGSRSSRRPFTQVRSSALRGVPMRMQHGALPPQGGYPTLSAQQLDDLLHNAPADVFGPAYSASYGAPAVSNAYISAPTSRKTSTSLQAVSSIAWCSPANQLRQPAW